MDIGEFSFCFVFVSLFCFAFDILFFVLCNGFCLFGWLVYFVLSLLCFASFVFFVVDIFLCRFFSKLYIYIFV